MSTFYPSVLGNLNVNQPVKITIVTDTNYKFDVLKEPTNGTLSNIIADSVIYS